MEIKEFSGEYEFLSNFYLLRNPVVIEGISYPTAEHAYQAMKTFNIQERIEVSNCSKAAHAKRLGKKITLRPDWNYVKDDVMRDILYLKFTNNPELATLLLNTGDMELIEGNWWGDTYWGVSRGVGQNRLGNLLMKLRSSLEQGQV